MTRDIQRAILRACARFIGKKVELFERRIASVEERAAAALTEKDLAACREGFDGRLRELQLTPGPQGAPGRDAEQVDVGAIADAVIAKLMESERLVILSDVDVGAAVARYFEENPVRHGRDGADGAQGERGEKGETGASGTGLADAVIDRDGALVLTMTDGRTKSLGVVVGTDGAAGADGRDGDHGLSFDTVDGEYDAERGYVLRMGSGDRKAEIVLPYMVHRGFWREGMGVKAAQSVTHDGALWIAKRDNAAKPCLENAEDWILAARKGRDGRDGKSYTPPPQPVRLGGGDGA